MLAQALDLDYPIRNPQKVAKKSRPQGRLSPHQRLVLKAEAMFPGSVIISSPDAPECHVQ